MKKVRLYPVVQAITGTTPRGGGTWRWILRHPEAGIFARNLPAMVQALHFKDYPSITPKHLARWREKPLRAHYNGALGLDYRAPLFVDSGGYLFLSGPPPSLERYGIHRPLDILRLALDLVDGPGDRVTPLDYPLPPGLPEEEALARLRRTRENALEGLRHLARHEKGELGVGLVLPVHGRTPEEAAAFARSLVEAAQREGFLHLVAALGLGSMVPLRKAHRTEEIVAFAQAVKRAVPHLPLHVFGVTGLLIPFLVAAGADTFDTTGYVQKARALKYLLPGSYRERRLWDLLEEKGRYPCACPACRGRDLAEDLTVLRNPEAERGTKSPVYGAVALHNLEVDLAILREAERRTAAGELWDYLQELVEAHPRLKKVLEYLEGKRRVTLAPGREIKNDPEAFDWRRTGWRPQAEVLLLVPCAAEKPYTQARSVRPVLEAVRGLPVDVVFLSGLYGPVPLEFVEHPAVLAYDFLLRKGDKESYRRIRERLLPLLGFYRHRVAYLAPPAYREVVQGLPVTLLPKKAKGLYTGRRKENLAELRQVLESALERELI